MIADPILPRSRVAEMARRGLWPDRLLLDDFDDAVATHADAIAIVDARRSSPHPTTLTYGDLDERVRRIAEGFGRLGVERGDVVAVQLPNWWQFTATHLACLRIGAITNPLMPIFRHRELSYMLAFAQAKLIVVPRAYRDFDYPRMLAELRPELPALERVLVVDGENEDAFESALLGGAAPQGGDSEPHADRRPGANDVVELIYTSGTTGRPKGVMHTSNTLFANLVEYIACLGLGSDDSVLMASPLAHQTGFLFGVMMPIMLRTKVVLQDVWSPDVALAHVERERLTFSMASTPFLADLTASPAAEERDLGSLKCFVSAGAPIPRVLVERAAERLGVFVHSGWGMTENGCVTLTRRGDPPEKVFGTDGAALPGMELRVSGTDGMPLAPGREGRLQVRGASNFVGYLKQPEAYDTDEKGWFDTGDLARMDADGYIRIVGRRKDIIIRGGENIPVVEVEQILYRHPAIRDVAIVATPDARLGERAIAYVTLAPGAELSFEAMAEFLEQQKMAAQYRPEFLEIIERMPRTPSGKIQKFKLRERAAKRARAAGRRP